MRRRREVVGYLHAIVDHRRDKAERVEPAGDRRSLAVLACARRIVRGRDGERVRGVDRIADLNVDAEVHACRDADAVDAADVSAAREDEDAWAAPAVSPRRERIQLEIRRLGCAIDPATRDATVKPFGEP